MTNEEVKTLKERKEEIAAEYSHLREMVMMDGLPVLLPKENDISDLTITKSACEPRSHLLLPSMSITILYSDNIEEYLEDPYDEADYITAQIYRVKGGAPYPYVEITHTGLLVPARDGDIPERCGVRFLEKAEARKEAIYWSRIANGLIYKAETMKEKASFMTDERQCYCVEPDLYDDVSTYAPWINDKSEAEIRCLMMYPSHIRRIDEYYGDELPWPSDAASIEYQTKKLQRNIETVPDWQKTYLNAAEIEKRLCCDNLTGQIKDIMDKAVALSKEMITINRKLPEMKTQKIAYDIISEQMFADAINRAGYVVEGLDTTSGTYITSRRIKELYAEAQELGIKDEVDRIVQREFTKTRKNKIKQRTR